MLGYGVHEILNKNGEVYCPLVNVLDPRAGLLWPLT